MRVYQEDNDGDRGLLKDIEGEYMTVTNLHYNEKHPYWANLCFWRDIDSGRSSVFFAVRLCKKRSLTPDNKKVQILEIKN